MAEDAAEPHVAFCQIPFGLLSEVRCTPVRLLSVAYEVASVCVVPADKFKLEYLYMTVMPLKVDVKSTVTPTLWLIVIVDPSEVLSFRYSVYPSWVAVKSPSQTATGVAARDVAVIVVASAATARAIVFFIGEHLFLA